MAARALFLAFGKVSVPATALAHEGAALAAAGGRLGRQVALIGPGTPAFRLNSSGWLSVPPALIAALTDRAGLRLLCRDRLRGMTPPFAAAAARWVDGYLDRAAAAAGPAGDGMAVTHSGDRFFASLLPLPAARLLSVEVTEARIVPGADAQFVPVDLAFWDGATLTALVFGPPQGRTPRQRRALDVLAAGKVPHVAVLQITCEAEGQEVMDRLIATARAVPPPWFGPFRAEGFHAPLP